VVGKRFGAAGKNGSSPGDRYTAARLGRGSTTATTRYAFGGGRFRVQGAPVRCWGPRGGGSRTGGRSEVMLDGEAHGGCDCGALEARHGGAA
jgi:hypothetical protein